MSVRFMCRPFVWGRSVPVDCVGFHIDVVLGLHKLLIPVLKPTRVKRKVVLVI